MPDVQGQAIIVREHGEPEVMSLEECQFSEPGPGQVLVRMKAAGVNPVDAKIRSGLDGYGAPLPYTPGKDGAGVVEAVGDGVKKVAPGDRVFVVNSLNGTYATHSLCLEVQVWPLPEGTSFAEGACLGVPAGTAYRALIIRANARPGEVVLVHGASGGVGIFATQLAASRGMTVIGTASTERGMQLVRDAGACKVYNHRKEGYQDEIARDYPSGVNVVIEVAANVNLAADIQMVAHGGRIVCIGSRGSVEIEPRTLYNKECTVTGVMIFKASEAETVETYSAISAALKKRALVPVIEKELRLAEAATAHHDVTEHAGGSKGNIVLIAP